jgi:hypothetical protein
MSFTKNKYKIVKNAIKKDLAQFIFNYFNLKKDAIKYMYAKNIIPEHCLFGTWNDPQVLNVYSHYGDFAMETLLKDLLNLIEEETGLKLIPTYSFARIYEKGSILKRHKDRPSCEISTTLNLGGDPWPIFIDPTGANNVLSEKYNIVKKNAPSGIQIDLEPGDMLVYSGCELEHWREEFKGNICAQVFLHYNNKEGLFKDNNLFDNRPLLGLPTNIKHIPS